MIQQKRILKKMWMAALLLCLTSFMGGAQTLDVLTYNIRYDNPADSINSWDKRKDFLIGQLNFYTPDIFGTQEGLLHQLEDIDNGLEAYSYFGKGRDDGNISGEFSAIFYNTSKVELMQQQTFWLSETPEVPSKGWDAAIKRVCTYGKFKDLTNNSNFWVFNTHFDHIGEQARKESISLILHKISEINTESLPVILMGDLNLKPQHKSITYLADQMDDTYSSAGKNNFGPEGTFNGFNFHEAVVDRIDYIFTSKGDFEILKNAILSDSKDCRYPSDHLPVYARLGFK